jgi:hypothetical protein
MMKALLYLFLILGWFALPDVVQAQSISYQISSHPAAGNPGSLNQEDDFSATGWTLLTPGGLSANQWSNAVTLPFGFDFFGQTFTSCRLSANGLLTFGSGSGGLSINNTALPNGSLPDHTIACYWEQFTLTPPTSTNDFVLMKTFGSAPHRQCWFRWYSFEWGAASFAYLAVVLEESSGEFHLVDQYSSAALNQVSTTVGAQQSSSFAVMQGHQLPLASTGSAAHDNHYYTFTPYPVPPEDLRPIALPGLAHEGCSDGPEPLTLRWVNQGQLPSSGVTLGYAINGGPPVVETLTQAMAPGDTFVHTFTDWPDFSAGGDFSLSVWTSSPVDTSQQNDTLHRSLQRSLVVTQFPYVEDFEGGPGGWRSGGNLNSWELGTPVNPVIQGAASGTQAWITRRLDTYGALENSYVISPCLDFSSLGADSWLAMQVWWQSESPWDGAAVQASLDGGQTWQIVGSVSPDWYNSSNVASQPGGQLWGWSGRNANGSGGWRAVRTQLPANLIGQPTVRLRVIFAANATVQSDGFAFDRVLIGTPPSVELGPGGPVCDGTVLDAGSSGDQYLWSTGDTSQTLTLTNPGPGDIVDSLVVVTVSNALGLTRSDSVRFSLAAPIQASVALSQDASCHLAQDGQIDLAITGGVPPYTVLWSHGATGTSVSQLGAGWYTATLTDWHGCPGQVDSVQIEAPARLEVQAVISHLRCYGDSSGAIELAGQGGNGGYQWSWATGDSGAWRDQLAAGTYLATLTDSLGCTLTRTYVVDQPDSLTIALAQATNASCPTQMDGSLEVLPAGGTGPYTFAWDHGATTALADSLGVGTYAVSLTDAQGCARRAGPWTLGYQDSLPEAAFGFELAKDILTTHDSSRGATSYRWQFGDGQQSTQPEPQYQYGDTGQFVLILTVQNGCGSDTAQALIEVLSVDTTQVIPPPDDTTGQDTSTVGLWSDAASETWQVYPNPTAGTLTMVLPAAHGPAQLRFYDLSGREVWQQALPAATSLSVQLPASLPAGLYQLQLQNSDRIYATPCWLRY